MRTIKLTVEYDGTPFHGWQVQPDAPTVQEALEQAVESVTQEKVTVVGSGRTDAGVHALGQVAHVQTGSPLPVEKWVAALNAHLPPEIAVTAAEEAPDGFHARYSARSKTYRYRILNRRARSARERTTAWWIQAPLDVEAMACAAGYCLGPHDFTAFESKSEPESSGLRRMLRLEVQRCGEHIDLWFEATGFLYNMVRAMVGTLVQVGLGKIPPEQVARILESRDRAQAGPTAPPHGLCLMEVRYE